jgi:hypothetical protein
MRCAVTPGRLTRNSRVGMRFGLPGDERLPLLAGGWIRKGDVLATSYVGRKR